MRSIVIALNLNHNKSILKFLYSESIEKEGREVEVISKEDAAKRQADLLDKLSIASSISMSSESQSTANSPSHNSNRSSKIVQTITFEYNIGVRQGYPDKPQKLSLDQTNNLLVISDAYGGLRVLGKPNDDYYLAYGSEDIYESKCLVNIISEKNLIISTYPENILNIWTIGFCHQNQNKHRTRYLKKSIRIPRGDVTALYTPFESNFSYIGTSKGDIYTVNLATFTLCQFSIYFHSLFENLSLTVNPGRVVGILENPSNSDQILFAYASGYLIFYSLSQGNAELLSKPDTPNSSPTSSKPLEPSNLTDLSWFHDGSQIVVSYTNGSLAVFNAKTKTKSYSIFPHSDKTECSTNLTAITKIEWLSCPGNPNDHLLLFLGGLPKKEAAMQSNSVLTVMKGEFTILLEMSYPIIDFAPMTNTVWQSERQLLDSIFVLTEEDLVTVAIDHEAIKNPISATNHPFQHVSSPFSMDLSDSQVTSVKIIHDLEATVLNTLIDIKTTRKKLRLALSKTEQQTDVWPLDREINHEGISECEIPDEHEKINASTCDEHEIVITGHQDGSVKFWDASNWTLKPLFRLKTSRLFERARSMVDDPFSIKFIDYDLDTDELILAGGQGQIYIYRLSADESMGEVPVTFGSLDWSNQGMKKKNFVDNSKRISLKIKKISYFGSTNSSFSTQHGSIDNRSIDTNITAPLSLCLSNDENEFSHPLLNVKKGHMIYPSGFHPERVILIALLDKSGNGNKYDIAITEDATYCRGNKLLGLNFGLGIGVIDVLKKSLIVLKSTSEIMTELNTIGMSMRRVSDEVRRDIEKNTILGTS